MDVNNNNIRYIFTPHSEIEKQSLYLNFRGEITHTANFLEKAFYNVREFFSKYLSDGSYSVKSCYARSCQALIDACIQPKSNDRITVQRTSEIFNKIFSVNNNFIPHPKDKEWKRDTKEAINKILNQGLYEQDDYIRNLKEINENPRLAEARHALSTKRENCITQITGSVNNLFKINDRSGKIALGIFKVCRENSNDAVGEQHLSKASGQTKLNQKTSVYTEMKIENEGLNGIFQKFIKGRTLKDKIEAEGFHKIGSPEKTTLTPEHIDQFHLMAIFDLLNFNDDRHANNIMVDENEKIWAIDNSVNEHFAFSKDSHVLWGTKTGKEILNQPFSDKLKDYIHSLTDNAIVSNLDERKYEAAKCYIDFLKWASDKSATLGEVYGMAEFMLFDIKKDQINSFENQLKSKLEEFFKK